jgi:hypothetical protein
VILAEVTKINFSTLFFLHKSVNIFIASYSTNRISSFFALMLYHRADMNYFTGYPFINGSNADYKIEGVPSLLLSVLSALSRSHSTTSNLLTISLPNT